MKTQLSRRLRAARLKLGLTVREVETLSKHQITDGHISRIEMGTEHNPKPKALRALCTVLKLNYIEIMILAGHLTKEDLKK